MKVQSAGIHRYYIYQSAPEQGPGLISRSPGPGSRAQDADENKGLSDGEEQAGGVSRTREDDSPGDDGRPSASSTDSGLTQEEKRLVQELKKIDAEVRAHEMAHIAAGGEYITSGATFSYQQGPDGKNYAVGGEVRIDTSPEPGDPEATLKKMRQVRAAALAPAQPSSQDLKVASKAASQAAKAMAEITQLKIEERARQGEAAVSAYTRQQIFEAYTKSDNMFGQDTQNSFHTAV